MHLPFGTQVYWGLMHSEDEDSFTAGLNMMTLQQALKTVVSLSKLLWSSTIQG